MQNLVRLGSQMAPTPGQIDAIADQTSFLDVLPVAIDGRQPVFDKELRQALTLTQRQCGLKYDNRIHLRRL